MAVISCVMWGPSYCNLSTKWHVHWLLKGLLVPLASFSSIRTTRTVPYIRKTLAICRPFSLRAGTVDTCYSTQPSCTFLLTRVYHVFRPLYRYSLAKTLMEVSVLSPKSTKRQEKAGKNSGYHTMRPLSKRSWAHRKIEGGDGNMASRKEGCLWRKKENSPSPSLLCPIITAYRRPPSST
ncbi:hypothetical protein HOY80DRAFT_178926 [Tuber brumale]|nr:hypothetical protein HOY80DRAFT_178926 [Tuber brumale]